MSIPRLPLMCAAILALATLAIAVPVATAQPLLNRRAHETHTGFLGFTFPSFPPCGDATILTAIYTAELDFHRLLLQAPSGEVQSAETGTFEAVPSDPTLPTFTGTYSVHSWRNAQTWRMFIFVVARGSDGSIREGRLTRVFENVNGTFVLVSDELSEKCL
jgi:hypothetical protein